MSTEVFNFTPDLPYSEDIRWLTIVSESEGGRENRYQKWQRPLREFRINLRALSVSNCNSLWRMYNRMKGKFDFFYFQNPNENPVTLETVGSGDGVKSVFYLGGSVDVGTGDLVVTPASASLKRSVGGTGDYLAFTAFTIDDAIGQVTTNAVLPSGDVLRADYNFRYKIRFKEDTLTRDAFSPDLWNASVSLIEVV